MAAQQHMSPTVAAVTGRPAAGFAKTRLPPSLNHPMSRYTHCAELLLPGGTGLLPGDAGSQPPLWHRCAKEHRVMVGMRHDRAGAARTGSRETEGHRAAMAGMPILVLAVVIIFALALTSCSAQPGRASGGTKAAGPPALAVTTFAGYRGQLPLPGAPRLTVNALAAAGGGPEGWFRGAWAPPARRARRG